MMRSLVFGSLLLATSALAAASPGARTLSFDEALRQALAQHPSSAKAQAEIARAQATVEEVRAQTLPTLSVNAAGTLRDGDRAQGATVVQPGASLGANVDLFVPLVVPSRWAATGRAKQGVEVSRVAREEQQRQLALATARAYLTAVLEQRLLEVAERARDTAQAHFDDAHQRLAHGVGTRLDEARAEKELHDERSRVATAAANLRRAEEALGVLVGWDGPVHPQGEVRLPDAPEVQLALQGAGARSDVRGAKAQVALAEQAVRDDWLDYLPALGASFQPFVQTPGTVTTPTTGWQGQLVLSWSIFDGGYREGLHHERAARQASARADLDERTREALSEVRAARDQLDAAVDAQGEAEQSASAATEVLSLATRAYQAGASSNLEVVDAERDAHDAQARASMARDAVLQAKVALLSASGRFPG